MYEYYFKHNELYCEALPVREIVRRFGTPLYIYSANSVVDHCRAIERAFGAADHLTCYAVKANANRAILALLAREGIGADIGSAGELFLAREAGFPPSKITYSGVGKRRDEIDYALREGILAFNVESEEELRRISERAQATGTLAGVCVRVNLDIEAGTHPYITTGKKQNKFGIEAANAEPAFRMAMALPALTVLGIHIHIGSQILNVETFLTSAEAVLAQVAQLRAAGIPITQVNFGGGFGVQYRDYVTHPLLPHDDPGLAEAEITIARFIEQIVPRLNEAGCTILIQPGRSIIAHAGILATEIVYIKESAGRNFVIVDAGMNDFMRPALYQSYHQIVPLHLTEREHRVVDIVGPLCESGDFFALGRPLPQVDAGDHIALMCTGAYGYVLSSNYNARPRPAEVLVSGSECTLIRARESFHDL